MTLIICSECGIGHYIVGWNDRSDFVCSQCGHEIARRDIVLDADETLAFDRSGRLGYVAYVAGVAGEFE